MSSSVRATSGELQIETPETEQSLSSGGTVEGTQSPEQHTCKQAAISPEAREAMLGREFEFNTKVLGLTEEEAGEWCEDTRQAMQVAEQMHQRLSHK
jgi:hypothetical protein